METLSVLINKPDEFDRAVHGDDKIPALPSDNVLEIITKDGGMIGGRACCVITFETEVDGKRRWLDGEPMSPRLWPVEEIERIAKLRAPVSVAGSSD